MRSDRLPGYIATLGGVFFVVFGIWAVVSARSFYDRLAVWPPFNEHFIHDIGAFQIGLGLALLFALAKSDALLVALGATGIGQGIHAIVHFTDRELGGSDSDPITMAVLALMLLGGAALRLRAVGTAGTVTRH